MGWLGFIGAAFFFCQQAAAQYPFEVPYVPTPQVVVDEMLRAAVVGPQDFVIDLGSGDGRIPITAAKKFGARGLGVDLDFHLHIQSEEAARLAGVADRVSFLNQDLFKTDISQATVITMYLLPAVNRRLRPGLLDLKPGTRIVAHDFDFKQRFQEFDGLARIDGNIAQLWQPVLRGDRIRFVMVDGDDRENEASLYFDGRVSGGVMEGEIRRGVGNGQTLIKWRAVRSGP